MAHPASVNKTLQHSMDLLCHAGLHISVAFGPQHGFRGDKQDNMVESGDEYDSFYNIPVYSLYGKVRHFTPEMMDHFDALLVDIQDVGCRIYTFLTTLFYVMEDSARQGKAVYVLDRPNPAGRGVEGLLLDMNYESFVGAAPIAMRHGLTLGEAGLWYKAHRNLNLEYHVVEMSGYSMETSPLYGWDPRRTWVNPSPNLPRVLGTHIYPGTVLLEGTHLSEGRGTTVPLEVVGAPDFPTQRVLKTMEEWAPQWMKSCLLRPCFFEPTFQKHCGKLCSGIQIHVDISGFQPQEFHPYRLVALLLKATRREFPEFDLWKPPPYEYETKHLPFDILSGSSELRHWVEDPGASVDDLEQRLCEDEQKWRVARSPFCIY